MDFKTFSRLIMIEQTLFALPFAYLGLLFAGTGTWQTWVWVTLALAAARTAGMSFNRVIDAEIDAKNPRTADRPIPKGEVTRLAVWVTAILSSLLLIVSSFMLNTLCFVLSFPAVLMLVTYSYFKRFSSSSHFYLGMAEAAAPIGGYLAATGEFSVVPFILGIVIMMWIAGLDIMYAIQDMAFDVKEKLHSIPARLGKEKALILSALCYVLSMSALIVAGMMQSKGMTYWISLVGVAGIFIYQQKLAREKSIAGAMKKIFSANAYVSPILFLGTLTDVFLSMPVSVGK